jgi:hypothetical protein
MIHRIELEDPAWTETCDHVREHVSPGAIVVIPPEKQTFQTLSLHGAYYGFKHVPYSVSHVPEWWRRATSLGVFPGEVRASRLTTVLRPDYSAYDRLRTEDFLDIARATPHVTHAIIRTSAVQPGLQLLHQNDRYALYRIAEVGESNGAPGAPSAPDTN